MLLIEAPGADGAARKPGGHQQARVQYHCHHVASCEPRAPMQADLCAEHVSYM